MLLNFRCKNFKSFRDGFNFNMVPKARMTGIKYSILHEIVNSKDIQALSASVIYGPNAAGKTSIINAMSCFRQIILKGGIEDSEEDRTGDHVSANLSLAPFRFAKKEEPVSFGITFAWQGILYDYELSFRVGEFLKKSSARKIESEVMRINGDLIFSRTEDEVTELSLKSILPMLNVGCDLKDAKKYRTVMSANLDPCTLLLTSDFNSFCSKKIVAEFKEWIAKCFFVINSSSRKRFLPNMPESDGYAIIERSLNEIAREAGIIGSDFAYVPDSDTHQPKLLSVLEKDDHQIYGIDAELIESVGTMRLISIMPAVLGALKNGSTLVVDELDSSLHPMIVMNLITLFHNDEVNKNRAQLIFNTHNPIYLNNKLLRRDEIKFVERNQETKSSSLYALSDFKANGDTGARNTSDYMHNYFVNRYGAIEHIDFTDIVIELMNHSTGEGVGNG